MNTIGTKAGLLGFGIAITSYGQGFVNLNFESANVSPFGPGSSETVSATDAFPSWSVYWGAELATTAFHNTVPIGSVQASILGPFYSSGSAILEGNFTAALHPGFRFGFVQTSASLAQVGQVPSLAQSLLFKAANFSPSLTNLSVFLGGQQLNLFALESTPDYTLFGAPIDGSAGQVAELRFTAVHPGQPGGSVYLDGIQFSPQAVPEPSTWALLGLGSALFWYAARRRWNEKRPA